MKRKKDELKAKLALTPRTSKLPSSEKELEDPQIPFPTTSPISATSGDHVHGPLEPFESEITRRDGSSVFNTSSIRTESHDIQDQYVEDLRNYDTDQLVELYRLPGEVDPTSLAIYLPPGCLQWSSDHGADVQGDSWHPQLWT